MKNLLLVTVITLTMMIPLLLLSGCATQKHTAGSDWYLEVPKAEHEKRFPQGHRQGISAEDDKNCHFNKATNSYFCQFDWDE